jgi:hypothetical protein
MRRLFVRQRPTGGSAVSGGIGEASSADWRMRIAIGSDEIGLWLQAAAKSTTTCRCALLLGSNIALSSTAGREFLAR